MLLCGKPPALNRLCMVMASWFHLFSLERTVTRERPARSL